MQSEKDYSQNLHSGASKSIFENARSLRKTETPAEKIIWQYVRNRKMNGRKFRRQHPFDKYILDFYCHECKLALEIDGDIHNEKFNKEYDRARTNDLNNASIRVIRFTNEDVIRDIEKVLEQIENFLT
jgi:very-short-patch-repair endonuclease